jgi:hypothetical protein
MNTNSVMLGAAVAALSLGAMAFPAANAKTGVETGVGHDAAIEACSAVNPSQPVELSGAIDDGSGIGFSLVWLTDAETRLWMCDADADGYIYSYTVVAEDLLAGYGPELIGLTPASNGGFEDRPQVVAEKVCAAYLADGATVLASGSDGLSFDPGYAVFVKNAAGELYLCNATGDAMVWAFEPIGDPLNLESGAAVS